MRHKYREKSRKTSVKSLGVVLVFYFFFSISNAMAQESVNAAGGSASASGGSISYSIGQITYQNHTGSNGSVAEGVQQPYEILVVTAIEVAKYINLLVSAYPNPTIDYLTLEVKDFELSTLYYKLYDMTGKLIQNEKITGSMTIIVMSNLAPATYFVKVMQSNKEIKTFKIIKK
jgi:hypothetical protein